MTSKGSNDDKLEMSRWTKATEGGLKPNSSALE